MDESRSEDLVYLDNAATTRIDPRVAQRMAASLLSEQEYGNPSSDTHAFGDAARALVEQARATVAATVGATADEVVWTSGATEADNLAILGVAHYYRDTGNHVITARTEHKAVLDACHELERRGWQVTYLSPDEGGAINVQQVAQALRPTTVLVSLMLVNNEIGVTQDVRAIAALCAEHGAARLHVDAAQAVGKIAVDFRASGAQLMSLSAHKAYGPKGIGALLVARTPAPTLMTPLQFGGGQERGLRAGTLPTHQIVGMAEAYALAAAEWKSDALRIGRLQRRLWHGLASLGGVLRNGRSEGSVPHILNVSFDGVEGEALLAAVQDRLAVSTGSACTSASAEPSYVLRALGRDERASESSLRFGLGRFTREAEIDAAIEAVGNAVQRLRRIAGAS